MKGDGVVGRPITATIPQLYTTDLLELRRQFQPGMKFKINIRYESVDHEKCTMQRTIRVVAAYQTYVLFRDSKGVKYTYTYPELVKMGLCKAGGC